MRNIVLLITDSPRPAFVGVFLDSESDVVINTMAKFGINVVIADTETVPDTEDCVLIRRKSHKRASDFHFIKWWILPADDSDFTWDIGKGADIFMP